MKKMSDDYADRQARIVRYRLRNQVRKGRKPKAKKTEPLAAILKREPFFFCKYCSFAKNNIDESLESLSNLRKLIQSNKKVLLDFSETEKISATFGVYLYAEIHSLIVDYGDSAFYLNIQSIPPKLRFIIKESGLLRLINHDSLSVGKRGFLPILCGTKDDEIDVIIDYIIRMAEMNGQLDIKDKAEAEFLTNRAITEAMLNVDYHAYPDRKEGKYWWFNSMIFNNDLYISLCDRGVGIHNTLPRKDWWEIAMGGLPINDDGQMIQAAMAYTRTARKNKKGRGLGTKDMQNLVLERKEGFMTIVSGRGHYTLDAKKESGKERIFRTKIPVFGTIVNWRIPLG